MYTCIRVSVFCRRQFSVKQLKFEIYIILCQYFITVFFRVLKIKLKVKLTFWTAISSHQVMASWLSFVVSSVSLSLSHWYPGSGVVLDCIDS